MLVYEHSAASGAHEIVAAILAATSLATLLGNHVADGVERDCIAWQLLYPTDVIHHGI